MKKTDDELEARDAQRDIGSELLSSVREMMADKRAREHAVDAPDAATARIKIGLSQSEFATLLGVSKRTLQDWEQGRREPSGAAKSTHRVGDETP